MPIDPTKPVSEPEYDLPWWREKAIVRRIIIGSAVVLAVALLGVFVGWPAFLDFRKNRIVRIAKVFIADEDYRSAYLLLDQHVKTHADNLPARRLLAKVLEEFGPGMGTAEWKALCAAESGNPENFVGYITSLLRTNQVRPAGEALATLQRLAPDSLDYYRLSAALALARRDIGSLRRAVENLMRLDPQNDTHRFNLASLQLQSLQPEERAAARAVLDDFAKGDRLRIRAGLALIQDAAARWPEVQDPEKRFQLLVRQLGLLESPLERPSSKVLLSVYRVRTPGLALLISHLLGQQDPLPEDAVLFTQWLLQANQPRDVLVWLETLPGKTRSHPSVLAARAAAVIAIQAWDGLEELLLADAWGPVPAAAVRYAMQARQLREQGIESRAEAVWNNAVQASADSLPGLRMLHRLATLWHWAGKETQVLWTLVKKFPADQQAWRALVRQGLADRDTSQVWRAYTAWAAAAPDDTAVQLERLVIGLLTQPGDPSLAPEAAAIFARHPDFPGARLAQAIAHWRAGRAGEALALLDLGKIDPAQEPRLALARGLALAALRRVEESEKMLSLCKPEHLLPEEVALIKTARAEAR